MDDLTELTQIGTSRARWLHERWGVETFADLAALPVDEVETAIRTEGLGTVSRDTVERWTEEAGARAAAAQAWRPVASFVVEFQHRGADPTDGLAWRTTVHHVEGDRNERWPGVDCPALAEWMTAQFEPPGAADSRTQTPPRPAAAATRSLGTDLRWVAADGDGTEPVRFVRIDKAWSIFFEWPSADVVSAEPDGEWELSVLLAPLQLGAPIRIGTASIAADAQDAGGMTAYRMTARQGLVTETDVQTPFRVTATLRYVSGERMSTTGIVELGILWFYEPAAAGSPVASVS